MDMPEDVLGYIASFGRLSQWMSVMRFDVRYAACCRIQRTWRQRCATARFIIGSVVRVRAKHDRSSMVARLVARDRRGLSTESWTARVMRSGFRHFVYIRRLDDPMYVVVERVRDYDTSFALVRSEW